MQLEHEFSLIDNSQMIVDSIIDNLRTIRASILKQAFEGKLAPQDPNDEPASVLIKKIFEEKSRLIAEGKIQKKKPLPSIEEEEKSFELPDG